MTNLGKSPADDRPRVYHWPLLPNGKAAGHAEDDSKRLPPEGVDAEHLGHIDPVEVSLDVGYAGAHGDAAGADDQIGQEAQPEVPEDDQGAAPEASDDVGHVEGGKHPEELVVLEDGEEVDQVEDGEGGDAGQDADDAAQEELRDRVPDLGEEKKSLRYSYQWCWRASCSSHVKHSSGLPFLPEVHLSQEVVGDVVVQALVTRVQGVVGALRKTSGKKEKKKR